MATDASGHRLGINPALHAGDRIRLKASGFKANAKVKVVLHSTPTTLATVQATAAGVASYTFVVPTALTGSHSVVLSAGDASRTFTFHVVTVAATSTSTNPATVAAAATGDLPRTGAQIGGTLGLALILILLGAGALMATRRAPSPGRHR